MTTAELLDTLDTIRRAVPVGSWWRHHRGKQVYVVAVALDEATLAPRVIYTDDGVHWDRPLADFLGEVEAGVRRFVRVG